MKQFMLTLMSLFISLPVLAAGGGDVTLRQGNWSFDGPFGTFDKAAITFALAKSFT